MATRELPGAVLGRILNFEGPVTAVEGAILEHTELRLMHMYAADASINGLQKKGCRFHLGILILGGFVDDEFTDYGVAASLMPNHPIYRTFGPLRRVTL